MNKHLHTLFPVQLLFCALLLAAGLLVLDGRAQAGWLGGEAGVPEGAFTGRVYYQEIADIERLASYDVWEYNNLAERYVLVSMDQNIYERLRRQGWKVAVDAEATAMLTPAAGPETFYGGYRTVDELHADLDTIHAAYPTITEIMDYGDSYCKVQGGCVTLGGEAQPGYDLKAVRVTNQAIAGPKPVFFLMANIHAREITTPELAMRMLDWLVEGYNVNPDATWIVDYHEVWIVPSVNPDGHWLVELGTLPPYSGSPFSQRKNANRDNGCTTWPPSSFSQYGIDLNRNHSFAWGGGGASACDLTYRGPSAASEHEIWQLQDQLSSIIPDQRGPGIGDPAPEDTTGILITMHSYSELVLWPWGYTASPAPNKAGLEAIGDKLATYNGYTSCQPPLCLYAASGTTDDWSYGELGIPSFTFEVGTQFMPPYNQVDDIQWPENGPALQYAARIARTPYMLVNGPDALDVAVSDNGDGTHTLTAEINEALNGNQNVANAEYYLDIPAWITTTLPISVPMTAADGAFDSPVEIVQAVVDGAGLSLGRHMLYVRGQDSEGNWGPFSAVFLDIEAEVAPTAGFTTSSPDPVGATTVFTNTSTGTNLNYSWDFGDGSPLSNETNPTHIYTASGLYTVTLTATNSLGSDSAVQVVEIEPYALYLPVAKQP